MNIIYYLYNFWSMESTVKQSFESLTSYCADFKLLLFITSRPTQSQIFLIADCIYFLTVIYVNLFLKYLYLQNNM